MEKQEKRIRHKSFNRRWTKEGTQVFLQKILENKNHFEKPSAQIFYKNLINEEPCLAQYAWMEMRDRVRNLKVKYRNALAWRASARPEISDENSEKTIDEYTLKLCPFFNEMHEILEAKKANLAHSFSYDSTDSTSVLEGEVNMDGAVVIAQCDEEYPLNQSTWITTSTSPEVTEEHVEIPNLHSVFSYKERLSENPGKISVRSLGFLPQLISTEKSQQHSKSEVECQSASKNSERTEPPVLLNVSRLHTPGKTEKRKIIQPQPSTSRNKNSSHDHETSLMSSAIDKLLEISNHSSQDVNKEDSFDHFGKYVASMLRDLGKPTAMKLQQNITNMITNAVYPQAEFSSAKKADAHQQLIAVAEKLASNNDTKPMDTWESFGLSVGGDLRNMERKQQVIAQKLISDVIFLAKTERFDKESGINVSSIFQME